MTSKTFYQIHFTGEGFRTLAVYRRFFKAALTEAIKVRADYDAEVRDWYENGEGASAKWVTDVACANCGAYFGSDEEPDSAAMATPCEDNPTDGHVLAFRRVNVGGRGYAFPHCIHGSSRWTDYDNICGGCEDPSTAIEDAIVRAREQFLRFNQRWEWVQSAPGDLDFETRKELNVWAASLFPGFKKEV